MALNTSQAPATAAVSSLCLRAPTSSWSRTWMRMPAPDPASRRITRLINRADTPGMALCGARTDDGTPCGRTVRSPGLRCWQHGGPRAPAHGKRRSSTSRTRTSPRRSLAPAGRRPATGRAASERTMWQAPAPAPSRWQQQPAPPPPSRRAQEHERVRQAAVFCADSLSDGWQEAVADRITG
jgi:hypothetical protein